MPIPDNIYFGERPNNQGGISYGEARNLSNDIERIYLLKARIDSMLIDQIDELTSKGSKEGYLIWSPFPLVVLTCLAIETLGRIILDVEDIESNNEYEISKKIATPIYRLIDKELSYKPNKVFFQNFLKLHNLKQENSVNKYSDILHRYLRNSFNHGYQARGVFLSHATKDVWEIDSDEGYIKLNPYLFWRKFRNVYEIVFHEIVENKNKEWRTNALKYLDNLLN